MWKVSARGCRQGVVVALTMLAGDAGSVSVLCQIARALVSAAEHVGKQIEGVAGCRASGGSGGMAGGCDELIDALLQAASGSTSSKSIRKRVRSLFVRIFCYLRLRRSAALFLIAGGLDGHRPILSGIGAHARNLARTGRVNDIGAGREAGQNSQQIRQ